MCGIVGIIARYEERVDLDRVKEARDMLYHRGPDDAGVYLDPKGRVGLGHRRLSIIDLSEAARQPMCNETGTIWMVFNGEIYNYKELIPLLEARGHVFRSTADSEVIVHAYEEWGVQCLSQFVGMFAFAIWDEGEQQLFLARDHLGIKPLYYYYGKQEIMFASEMKAIVKTISESRCPNYTAIYDFLTITRFDHDRNTFFESIFQLRPGHYLLLNLEQNNGFAEQRSYWACSPERSSEIYDYRRPVEIFREYFGKSIELQLRSDVPVGAFLSGGLDSSSILALASQKVKEPLRVFSVVYNEKECDERQWINDVTSAFRVIQKKTMPNQDKMVIDLERFVWFQETPTNGPGPFSEWCVAELAASSVKVVLSGQGADEMLGGYHYFYEPYFKTRLKELLINHGNGLSDLWREIICVSEMTGMPFWYYLSYMLMPYPEQILHLGKRVIRDKLFLREFRTKGKKLCSEQHDLPDGATLLDRRLSDSILGWGLSRLLHYLDRNSMAFSLEARVPFLDHRLVEYCLGLPYYWKIQGVSTKHVLREAMSDILPKSIIERRDKKGFETPLAGWLHASQQWVRDLLSNQSFIKRGIFDPKQIELTLNNFFNEVNKKGLGRRTYSWEIWRMIQLELWFMLFLDA